MGWRKLSKKFEVESVNGKYIFAKYNANPRNKNIGDCAIRTLSVIFERPYKEIKSDIKTLARLQGQELDDIKVIAPIVYDYAKNYYKDCAYVDFQKCKTSFAEIVEITKYRKNKIILVSKKHLAACIDGCLIDTWDSGNEILEGIYILFGKRRGK